MDTISHSETSLLEHQEINAPFMTKNVSFAFFPWVLLGHSKKTLTFNNRDKYTHAKIKYNFVEK